MKSKKILKIILVVLLLLIITFGIYLLRNYIILKKISKLSEQIKDCSFVSTYHQEIGDGYSTDNTFECYYKDGISKIILKGNDENADFEIEWYNENTNEYINARPKDMAYDNKFNGMLLANMNGITCPTLDLSNINILDTIFPIYKTEINGEKCYLINRGNKSYTAKIYINTENGRILKLENGNRVTEYSNFKTDVSDEEVSKPDLTGYVDFQDRYKK